MPFTVNDPLLYKRSERQRREIHEREYSIYLHKLHQQHNSTSSSTSSMSYLSAEHLKNLDRSCSQRALNRLNQYKHIQRENELLAKRLAYERDRPMCHSNNKKYQENLQLFQYKQLQHRSTQYKRIDEENEILSKRLKHVRGAIQNKGQCERDWQRHVQFMKKTSYYPENIDRFVSHHQQRE